ncbi:MAG: glycosyltransferase [Patescibacteria group bacterium]
MEKLDLLSIVIPAYKQEKTIAKDIKRLNKVIQGFGIKYEIIVVVDGFMDRTYKKLKSIKINNLKIYGYKDNRGKGYAVTYGMLKAKGDIIGFIDAGMDIDPSAISMLLDFMKLHDADIVVGSKLHPDSIVRYPLKRKILSWGYRTFTHLLFGFNIRDTQVGLKLFKKEVVRRVFPKILVKQFAFDVEVLAVSYAYGYTKIYEAPIKLTFKDNSSITSGSFWKIILLMLWDTTAVFYKLKVLHYYNKQ